MTLPLGQFLTVWAFLALNILSPGPNVINTIASAMGSGRRAGMGSACGVGLGIGLWCLGMSLGISALFRLVPMMQTVLTVVAIGLLCLFANRYLRNAWAGWHGRRSSVPQGRQGMDFRQGFQRSMLINLLNPKALTSWLAVLSLFPVERATAGDIALLCLGACCLSFSIHSGYTLIFSTPPAARIYLKVGWAISGAAGMFFSVFAIKLMVGLVMGH